MRPEEIEAFYSRANEDILADGRLPSLHQELLAALEAGSVRAARRNGGGEWEPCPWVKRAILCGFRFSRIEPFEAWPGGARDKAAYPPRAFGDDEGVRLVPGGSAVRRGAFIGRGVVVMPPAYVNVGAYVGAGTMVDSHALVGSCAQIGEGVHLSAGVQVGGVLEPEGARPVVVEDGAFIGALSGLLEGAVVRSRAVLAPGVIITASTAIYDLARGRELRGEVPEGAVVVPGSRPARGDYAAALGIRLYAPCVVKYRDGKTDAATLLEEALR
jgi:2,3,4,5-tetrahydropyridine-2-carboxylate N-succinyltransferase